MTAAFSRISILPGINREFPEAEGKRCMTKQSNLDAKRTAAVLVELQKSTSILLSTVPFSNMDMGRNEQSESDYAIELVSLLAKYSQESMLMSQSSRRDLSSSVKTLAKLLYRQSNEEVSHRQDKSPVLGLFQKSLHEILTKSSKNVFETVEEDSQVGEKVQLAKSKERKVVKLILGLQEEIEKAKKQRSDEVSSRNDVIRRLKGILGSDLDELNDIKRQAEDHNTRLEVKSKQKIDLEVEASRERKNALTSSITALKLQVEQCQVQNRENEALGRKRIHKIEGEIQNWIAKYDQDMGEKQEELDVLAKSHLEAKLKLDQSLAQYDRLKSEHSKILAIQAKNTSDVC